MQKWFLFQSKFYFHEAKFPATKQLPTEIWVKQHYESESVYASESDFGWSQVFLDDPH